MSRHVARVGGNKNTKTSLVESEKKKDVRRIRSRWEDNIKMLLMELRRDGMDWIYFDLKIKPVMGCCGCGYEPLSSRKMRGISWQTEKLLVSEGLRGAVELQKEGGCKKKADVWTGMLFFMLTMRRCVCSCVK
jgi:hypothetical protein